MKSKIVSAFVLILSCGIFSGCSKEQLRKWVGRDVKDDPVTEPVVEPNPTPAPDPRRGTGAVNLAMYDLEWQVRGKPTVDFLIIADNLGDLKLKRIQDFRDSFVRLLDQYIGFDRASVQVGILKSNRKDSKKYGALLGTGIISSDDPQFYNKIAAAFDEIDGTDSSGDSNPIQEFVDFSVKNEFRSTKKMLRVNSQKEILILSETVPSGSYTGETREILNDVASYLHIQNFDAFDFIPFTKKHKVFRNLLLSAPYYTKDAADDLDQDRMNEEQYARHLFSSLRTIIGENGAGRFSLRSTYNVLTQMPGFNAGAARLYLNGEQIDEILDFKPPFKNENGLVFVTTEVKCDPTKSNKVKFHLEYTYNK